MQAADLSTGGDEFSWDRVRVDPSVLNTLQNNGLHQYIQLPSPYSTSTSSSVNAALKVPPQLRDIVAWSHTTLPNTSSTLTVNGVVPSVVVVDTGENYVMVGKRLAEQM